MKQTCRLSQLTVSMRCHRRRRKLKNDWGQRTSKKCYLRKKHSHLNLNAGKKNGSMQWRSGNFTGEGATPPCPRYFGAYK